MLIYITFDYVRCIKKTIMKKVNILYIAVALLITAATTSFAQENTRLMHKVVKQNGVAFVGVILSQDAREILIETSELGQIYIPKHEVREIIEVKQGEKAVTGGLFSTRYFLTTNGLSINKGDNYVQWNIFGPDFQFGVADNLTLGIMTSWVGMPIIGTAKYSHQFGGKISGGLGMLAGTGSWAFPEYGLVLPFGFISAGDRINNINFSAGYGALFLERNEYTYVIHNTPTEYSTNSYTMNERTYTDTEGRPLFSIAGMFRLNNKFSFVFDSFIMLAGKPRTETYLDESWDPMNGLVTYSLKTEESGSDALIVLAPGLRFQANENNSFQFGFTGVHVDGEFVPVPIPMVQWFRKI